jgi:CheY-like chemotaxis protein
MTARNKTNEKQKAKSFDILIVEDILHERELYALELSEEGYTVDTAENGLEAVEKTGENEYKLTVMDIRMPEMDGIEALCKILSRNRKMCMILYTAYPQYKSDLMTWTADRYITKSSDLSELKQAVKELIEEDSTSVVGGYQPATGGYKPNPFKGRIKAPEGGTGENI